MKEYFGFSKEELETFMNFGLEKEPEPTEMNFDKMKSFPNHKFKLYEGRGLKIW